MNESGDHVAISMKFASPDLHQQDGVSGYFNGSFGKTDAFKELDALIGLKPVKRTIAEIAAFALIQNKRSENLLKTCPGTLHMVFRGNPGTGKTSVARILAKIFKDIGILSKGHMLEAERADLVGEYIGHTALKTQEMLKKARGGILFIDEAYTLAEGGEKDFGKEAIATIVKAMEDHRDDLIVILAGYRREMNVFMNANPGLRSRFPIQIEFPDYDSEELFQIALQMYQEREYEMSNKCRWKMKCLLDEFVKSHHPHSGNARYVRNLVEKSIRLQALRLVDQAVLTRSELMRIEDYDICELQQIHTER